MSDQADCENWSISAGARIGHVHLTVANLERAEEFYRGVFGFEVTDRLDDATFLAAGNYHHHLALNIWAGPGAPAPAPGTTGLHHFAILYPSRRELARALRRALDRGVAVEVASDHLVSEAIYVRDPDGNGIELTFDRDRASWPKPTDGLLGAARSSKPLDLESLLLELASPADAGARDLGIDIERRNIAKETTMMTLVNQTSVQAHYDRFNRRDRASDWLERGTSVLAPDFSWTVVPTGETLTGPGGYRAFLSNWATAFSDARIDLRHTIATESEVVCECSFRGTHDGVLQTAMGPVPATGRSVDVSICDIFHLSGQSIASIRVYFDLLTMMRQLGLVPAPETAAR